MNRSRRRASRPLALLCALAVSATLPTKALASDSTGAERPASLRASAERAAAVESHRLERSPESRGTAPATAKAQSQTSGDPALERGSFFRTPAGIVVLAVFGIGVGYALYSSSNDRIHGIGR